MPSDRECQSEIAGHQEEMVEAGAEDTGRTVARRDSIEIGSRWDTGQYQSETDQQRAVDACGEHRAVDSNDFLRSNETNMDH